MPRTAQTCTLATSARRRGAAMMMVMIVVGAAGVLAFGITASSAMRAKVAQASVARLQAQYLAESGLNLSVYYLKRPSASPVGIGYGENGNVHYRGESAMALPGVPGTITTSVTNPANGQFKILSTGTFEGQSVTATALVTLKKSKQLKYAANLAGVVRLSSRTTITGGVLTNGTLQLATLGQVVGLVSTAIEGSSADVQSTDFSYPVSLFAYLPTYFHEGKAYQARVLTDHWNGGAMVDNSADNPLNVWYADRTIKIKGATTLNGSLILAEGRDLEMEANLTVTARSGLPALVVGDEVILTRDYVKLQSDGVTYFGNHLRVSGTLGTMSQVDINGSLICPRSGFPFSTLFRGLISIDHTPSKANMEAFADEMEVIDAVTVNSWITDTARPQ